MNYEVKEFFGYKVLVWREGKCPRTCSGDNAHECAVCRYPDGDGCCIGRAIPEDQHACIAAHEIGHKLCFAEGEQYHRSLPVRGCPEYRQMEHAANCKAARLAGIEEYRAHMEWSVTRWPKCLDHAPLLDLYNKEFPK